MGRPAALGLGSILVLCVLTGGCFEISDWEYEHYYYVEIRVGAGFTGTYNVSVPLPSASSQQEAGTELRYFNKYTDNLKAGNGSCAYSLVTHDSNKYLQIRGSSSASIHSGFRLWDSLANVSIAKEKPHETRIYSDVPNLSVIIDSRAVRKTNEKDYWDLYYSAAITTTQSFPVPAKNAWKDHLPEAYFLIVEPGWHSYPIQEMNEWNAVHIG